MERKPIIGITSSYVNHNYYMEGVYVHHDYHKAVIKAGGVPVILPIAPMDVMEEYIKQCDGFILSGGEDINPKFYNQGPHQNIGFFYTERDEFELALTKKILEQNKPLFAICRGMQLLNVALGGTLIQDIPSQTQSSFKHMQIIQRHKKSHSIIINKDSRLLKSIISQSHIEVNSLHHQAIDRLAEELFVAASSPDGLVEAVEHKSYKHLLAVQWHPESLAAENEEMLNLFRYFIDKSKK